MNKKALRIIGAITAIIVTFEFFSLIIKNFIHGWNTPV